MRGKYVLTTMLAVVLASANATVLVAQQPVTQQRPVAGARPLSIEEALRMATGTSEQVAVASAGVSRARGQQMQAKSQYFPQLNASVNYSRALASEFSGVFGSGSDTTATAPGDTTGGDGGIDFSNLPFGRKNTYTFGLSLQQNIFTGGRIKAQNRVADASRRTAEISLSQAEAQTTLDVAQAYYDAALAQRLADIAEATLAQADNTLSLAKLAKQVGNQSEFDQLRAQVTRDNQLPVVIQARSQRDLTMLRLKQLLDIPADQQLTLTSELLGENLPPVPGFAPAASSASVAMDSLMRAPVRQAAEGVQIQDATLDIAKSQRYPSIALTSQYGRVSYPENMLPAFNDLRTNWTAGLSLQLPVFTGGRIKGDELVAESNVSVARAQLRQTQELAALDTRSAYEQLAAAEAAWTASSGTVTQAQRAYDIAELRYKEGISTQLELNDSRLLLQQAQANRARAARDLQVARIRIVLLPNLPLGAGAGAGVTGASGGGSGAGGFTGGGMGTGAGTGTGAGAGGTATTTSTQGRAGGFGGGQ
jgi:outer membrane protein TolC